MLTTTNTVTGTADSTMPRHPPSWVESCSAKVGIGASAASASVGGCGRDAGRSAVMRTPSSLEDIPAILCLEPGKDLGVRPGPRNESAPPARLGEAGRRPSPVAGAVGRPAGAPPSAPAGGAAAVRWRCTCAANSRDNRSGSGSRTGRACEPRSTTRPRRHSRQRLGPRGIDRPRTVEVGPHHPARPVDADHPQILGPLRGRYPGAQLRGRTRRRPPPPWPARPTAPPGSQAGPRPRSPRSGERRRPRPAARTPRAPAPPVG